MKSKVFRAGDLFGTIFTLDADELFPVHEHEEGDNHITVVTNGIFRCTGRPEIEGKEIKAGDVLDWNPREPHGFIAVTQGARLVNILKKLMRK